MKTYVMYYNPISQSNTISSAVLSKLIDAENIREANEKLKKELQEGKYYNGHIFIRYQVEKIEEKTSYNIHRERLLRYTLGGISMLLRVGLYLFTH